LELAFLPNCSFNLVLGEKAPFSEAVVNLRSTIATLLEGSSNVSHLFPLLNIIEGFLNAKEYFLFL